jgi:hypothetical protein
MTRRKCIGFFALVLASFTLPARADLMVTFSSPTITPGSTGTLDVFLSSNASSSSPDQIYDTSFTVVISTSATGPAFGSQTYSYLNATNYVFYGDSNNVLGNPPSQSNSVGMSAFPNDTFFGADSLESLSKYVSLYSGGPTYLLASLSVDAGKIAGNYSVNLVSGFSNGANPNG